MVAPAHPGYLGGLLFVVLSACVRILLLFVLLCVLLLLPVLRSLLGLLLRLLLNLGRTPPRGGQAGDLSRRPLG